MINVPYYSEIETKVSGKYTLKASIVAWLNGHDIPHNPTSLRSELYSPTDKHRPPKSNYKIDYVIEEFRIKKAIGKASKRAG